MTVQQLRVTSNGQTVGLLDFHTANGSFSFRYDDAWLNDDGFLLSPRLTPDVCSGLNASAELRVFLANLLPEGQALDDVAAASAISKTNLYGLIRHLGRETTGALALLSADAAPATSETSLREIANEELSRRIRERADAPFSIWDGKVRLSIAGYQDKIAVFKNGDRLFLADGALASTHILKPQPRQASLKHLVVNEHFCMTLAKQIGLPVADVELIRVPEPVLLIQRFDRQRSEDGVRRVHVIDACQALGLPPEYKYERNFGNRRDVAHIRDGSSMAKLFSLIEHTHHKAREKLQLLHWCLFQYLIGNSDAHGKNLSFFVQRHALTLAPAYDLVCVEAHPEFEHEAAMAIGDNFNYRQVGPVDWAQFANDCGLPKALVGREMQKLAEMVSRENQPNATPSGYLPEEVEYLRHVRALMQERVQRMGDASKQVPKIRGEFLR